MPTDPNLQRQINQITDMKRSLERNTQTLAGQIRLLERQDRDSARLPNASRLQSQIRDQIRQARRQIDKMKQDIRTFDRQVGDLKRMQRQR